jgi:hypothetical protein
MIKRALTLFLVLHVLAWGVVPVAQAGMIGTQEALQLERNEAQLARIDAFLTRQEVRTQMLDLGVSPTEVEQRLAALTDEELQLIGQNIDSLPAGGSVLAVIGIVFVVLLILELVGITNIFTKV